MLFRSRGRTSESVWTLYAWGDTYVNWPRSNNDALDIVADKSSYNVGDTAHIVVKSPYQGKGVKALLTVEREQVISSTVYDVKSNAMKFDIPIRETSVPVVYASVTITKPRQGESFDAQGKDTGLPASKIGYIKLPVSVKSKEVTVLITTDKKKYEPGDEMSIEISTTDSTEKPVSAELSMAVVDQSLLDLTGFSLPDLPSIFYYERGLGIRTASM